MAQFYLGVMYENGQGLPKDSVESYICYSLATALGHKDAAQARDRQAAKLAPAALASAQAEAKRRFASFPAH